MWVGSVYDHGRSIGWLHHHRVHLHGVSNRIFILLINNPLIKEWEFCNHRAVQRSNCFHKNGHDADCNVANYWYIAAFALIQIILCQIPSFHKLTGLSVVATVMSFFYSFTGLGLAIAKVASESVSLTFIPSVLLHHVMLQS